MNLMARLAAAFFDNDNASPDKRGFTTRSPGDAKAIYGLQCLSEDLTTRSVSGSGTMKNGKFQLPPPDMGTWDAQELTGAYTITELRVLHYKWKKELKRAQDHTRAYNVVVSCFRRGLNKEAFRKDFQVLNNPMSIGEAKKAIDHVQKTRIPFCKERIEAVLTKLHELQVIAEVLGQ